MSLKKEVTQIFIDHNKRKINTDQSIALVVRLVRKYEQRARR
jgi:hypothetical protein